MHPKILITLEKFPIYIIAILYYVQDKTTVLVLEFYNLSIDSIES